MLELFAAVLFCWLLFKSIGLAFRITWGIAKCIVSVLFFLAVPLFIGCLLFAGGLAILLPLGLVALAFGILRR